MSSANNSFVHFLIRSCFFWHFGDDFINCFWHGHFIFKLFSQSSNRWSDFLMNRLWNCFWSFPYLFPANNRITCNSKSAAKATRETPSSMSNLSSFILAWCNSSIWFCCFWFCPV
jgi:hypothetical protein